MKKGSYNYLLINTYIRKQLSKIRRKFHLLKQKPSSIFNEIYVKNSWGDQESKSGPGSRLDRTDKIRIALPRLLSKYDCQSLLDIPCGDFNWMKMLDLNIEYIGADIVIDLIEHNIQEYQSELRQFRVANLLNEKLPEVDIILCRDCLVHFSTKDIRKALKNIKLSGSEYLLTTTFPKLRTNRNIVTGEWHKINLVNPPFLLPDPIEYIDDSYESPNYFDKSLGLWKISDIPDD